MLLHTILNAANTVCTDADIGLLEQMYFRRVVFRFHRVVGIFFKHKHNMPGVEFSDSPCWCIKYVFTTAELLYHLRRHDCNPGSVLHKAG